jgi:hypothetical protein
MCLSSQWIDRVKDFLMNGVDADIDSLQELLDETEGMPVAMVEADLLRSFFPHEDDDMTPLVL